MSDTIINSAAAAVVSAQASTQEATAALAAAEKTVADLGARVDALENEKQQIAIERRAGRGSDHNHGARLALIAQDIEDLASLERAASREVDKMKVQADSAKQALAAANERLETVKQDAILEGLISRATRLGSLLMSAVDEIEAHKPRKATSRNLWTPDAKLADTLRRLHLQR